MLLLINIFIIFPIRYGVVKYSLSISILLVYLNKVVMRIKLNLPMKRKNIKSPSSLIDAFSVRPSICKPFECRESLKIRNTRTSRITRRIAKLIAWLVVLSCGDTGARGRFKVSSSSATTVAKVIKYGIMAIISIMFMTSLKKLNLFGHAKNRTINSKVNHMIQSVSIRKNGSVISGTSSSSIFVPFVVVLKTL